MDKHIKLSDCTDNTDFVCSTCTHTLATCTGNKFLERQCRDDDDTVRDNSACSDCAGCAVDQYVSSHSPTPRRSQIYVVFSVCVQVPQRLRRPPQRNVRVLHDAFDLCSGNVPLEPLRRGGLYLCCVVHGVPELQRRGVPRWLQRHLRGNVRDVQQH